jgi:L-ascorbate 6-phosphate lactonase
MNDIRWHQNGKELADKITRTKPEEGHLLIWPFGQCGFIVKCQSWTVGFDLVLTDLDGRRLFPPPFPPETDLGLDYLFVSHDHSDHLDKETIVGLIQENPKLHVLLPKGIEDDHKDWKGEPYRFFSQNDEFCGADIRITAVPMAHETYKTDRNGDSKCLGYRIESGPWRIFHSGDGLVTEKLIEETKAFRPNLLFLPINGRDKERESRGIIGNMSAEEAVDFAKLFPSCMMIPMHHDLFAGNGYDIESFARHAQEQKQRYLIPHLGEMIDLPL